MKIHCMLMLTRFITSCLLMPSVSQVNTGIPGESPLRKEKTKNYLVLVK